MYRVIILLIKIDFISFKKSIIFTQNFRGVVKSTEKYPLNLIQVILAKRKSE